jgi:hypothetical protein
MSSFVYGALNAQREAAPEGTSKDKNAPGFGSYVDIVAALVPAEVLVANALLLPLMTSTTSNNPVTTKITDPGTLEVVFWLSIASCILLYVLGDRGRAKKAAQAAKKAKAAPGEEVEVIPWGGWSFLKMLIPAAAYVAWAMLQKSTAFDAIAPDMSAGLRVTIAVFAALLLAAIAKGFSDKADNKEPPAPTPLPADQVPAPAVAGPGG